MTNLRVVVFKDEDIWVAQCLEHDISAWGVSRAEMEENLLATLDAEANFTMVEKGGLFVGISPAPREFFDKWDGATKLEKPDDSVQICGGRRLSTFAEELAICA